MFTFKYNLSLFESVLQRIGFDFLRTSLTKVICLRVLELVGLGVFVWFSTFEPAKEDL